MRKINVFGRKVNQIRVVYLILALLMILLSVRLIVVSIMENELSNLQDRQLQIQQQINAVLASENNESYHEIGAIIQYLPNTFNETQVFNEFEFVKNLSGLSDVGSYQIRFDLNQNSPFAESLPTSVKFVLITVSMTTDQPDLIFDFADHLLDQDRIYHISSLSASQTIGGDFTFMFKIYTFYNDVPID